ncbi:MAG TPA: hypothetical protein VK466_08610, partial [Terriglobales bacterium]|nr:hypothetical protein [Terriglobales bacterium]
MKSTVTRLPLISFTLCSALAFAQSGIPAGTVLPASLNTSLNTKKLRAGQTVSARVMQEVPLPGNQKIPEGAKIVGHVVEVASADVGHPGTLAVRFDSVRFAHRAIPVTTSLRSIASLLAVEDAETPKTGPDRGTPYRWATRVLIGGEVYYGDGGPVTNGSDTVGEGLVDGVLAPVSAPRGSLCQHAPAQPSPQALWVFSSDACGVYGFENLQVTHAGY